MDLMLRLDPDTFAEAGSATEWDEKGQLRRLGSNQDNQDQNLMGCQLPHAGWRRVNDRRSDASTIPSQPQMVVRLQPQLAAFPDEDWILRCGDVSPGNAQGRTDPSFDLVVQTRALPDIHA